MIKALDKSVALTIRSTRNIVSQSQVAEELLLNSIDAGASAVDILIDPAATFVQVSDNGSGITVPDLREIASWNATSKSQEMSQHGFRGEALASIAAVSCMEIITTAPDKSGTYLKRIRAGHTEKLSRATVSRGAGTVVAVTDLFFNVPVRKLALNSSASAEMERTKQLVERVALAHTGVAITLTDSSRNVRVLQTRCSDSLLVSFAHLFGLRPGTDIVTVAFEQYPFAVSGVMSAAGKQKAGKDLQFIYVNNQFLSRRSPCYRVCGGAWSTAMARLFPERVSGAPTFALFLTCPADRVDLSFGGNGMAATFRNWQVLEFCLQSAIRKHFGLAVTAMPSAVLNVPSHTSEPVASFVPEVTEETLDALPASQDAVDRSNWLRKRFLVTPGEAEAAEESTFSVDTAPLVPTSQLAVAPDGLSQLRHRFTCREAGAASRAGLTARRSKSSLSVFSGSESLPPSESHAVVPPDVSQRQHDEVSHAPEPPQCEQCVHSRKRSLSPLSDSLLLAAMEDFEAPRSVPCEPSVPAVPSHGWISLDDEETRFYLHVPTGNTSFEEPLAMQARPPSRSVLDIPAWASASNHSHYREQSLHSQSSYSVQDLAATDAMITSAMPPLFRPNASRGIPRVNDRHVKRMQTHTITKQDLTQLCAIGQADKKFIVATMGDFIYAIDQHAADERVRLEEYRTMVIDAQQRPLHDVSPHVFNTPVPLKLTPHEHHLLNQYEQRVSAWHFLVKSDGADSMLVQTASVCGVLLTGDSLLEFLAQLDITIGAAAVPPHVDRILASKACRSAVMFGDSLTLDMCSHLLRRLAQCAVPFQCAHGRPSIAPLVNASDVRKSMTACRARAPPRLRRRLG
eukprot:TRINITY_DN3974_c0_g1_i1.p1 TRINITY_DN3974_c0_g1~~TRINITY_DN3974_c0_g1_i1.p1  ORF type:complete len:854 (+),score=159.23 TRINITY_DN3974_c0_g1_i1:208-2769(+)